jgi:imidazolonepropionase-like amidohydrolase
MPRDLKDLKRPLLVLLLCIHTYAFLSCAKSDHLALMGVTVIDGLGNSPMQRQVVLIRGDRIIDVASEEGYLLPRGTRIVELQGKFVMPGLIDMHAHVTILPMGEGGSLVNAMHIKESEQVLQTLLAFGITTVRNPAAPTEDGVSLRDRIAAGELLGPRLLTAGNPLNRTLSHFGPFVATANEAAVRKEVQRQAALGVDYIKVYASLSPRLTQVAIEEAHALGKKVIGHLQETTWTEAAHLGIDAITHGAPWSAAYLPPDLRDEYKGTLRDRITWLEKVDFDGPEIQEMVSILATRQIPIDPTLIAYHTKFFGDQPRHRENPEMQMAPASSRQAWKRGTLVDSWSSEDFEQAHAAWPRVLELTRKLHEGGVLLTAGSDFPNPWVIPGVGLHQELRLLHDAGIPPLEVLKIATHNGAVALGLADEIGSVEPGKVADLLVLATDPTKSLRNTRAIIHIFLGGTFLNPSALLASEGS